MWGREETRHEHQLVYLLAWIHGEIESLSDGPHLDNSVPPVMFDCVWFLDCAEYWAQHCHFRKSRGTNRLLTKKFVAWRNN